MNFKYLVTGAVLALGLALLSSTAAHANVILNYTGEDFNTATDKITASITLESPHGDNLNSSSVTSLAFGINDGVQSYTNTSPVPTKTFEFSTNGTGMTQVGSLKSVPLTILSRPQLQAIGHFLTATRLQ